MIIEDINSETKEGTLLITAIGVLLTLPGLTNKTLDEILQMLERINTLLKVEVIN
jgi:hypothetical protein